MAVLMTSLLFACSAEEPGTLGLSDGRLAACRDRPNCVSSDAEDEAHHIEPFRFSQAAAWSALKDAVATLPRTTIVTADEEYLHAEARNRVFGFVDDLEFHLRGEEKLIALRSAARTGYSDLGVNAERLETLRDRLQAEGVLP
ncbi:MAG: DUF1499 domain-containing protein [Alphaproteobacteria bacterium]|nr:DUF1499 domain-containing protein [Alphaproteobacteria bacterium]